METHEIHRDDARYPPMLAECLGKRAPAQLAAIGSLKILQHRPLGLICSIRCPGSVVIKTFDAIRELRDAGVVVAGGFHSPMEKECLDFLLRGHQPIVICPAKGLAGPRLPIAWRTAIGAGRLLLLSPFADTATRITAPLAEARNEFVAALSDAILIPHASVGGKADAIARQVLSRGQPLFTFADEANNALLQAGARPYTLSDTVGIAGKPSCRQSHASDSDSAEEGERNVDSRRG